LASALIKSIKLQDYKTFSSFEISSKRKNVLVGPNNSGKSTSLDALRILETVVRHCSRTKGKFKNHGGDGVCSTYWIPQTNFNIDLSICVKDFQDNTKAKLTVKLENGSTLVMLIDPDGPLEAVIPP
jgi:predicted ATPase